MRTANSQEMTDTVRALADIARELGHISSALAACAKGNSAEVFAASQEVLDRISEERQRREILDTLRRNGPTLFPELAAATLSLPDEIRPILQAMEREGLVEIRTMRGWPLISLTERGRREANRAKP